MFPNNPHKIGLKLIPNKIRVKLFFYEFCTKTIKLFGAAEFQIHIKLFKPFTYCASKYFFGEKMDEPFHLENAVNLAHEFYKTILTYIY